MIIHKIKKNVNNKTFKLILFTLSIIYSFVFSFLGLDFTDSFLNINFIEDFKNFPFVILTSLIGKAWIVFFGDFLIGFRILSWLFFIASITIAYLLLLKKKEWGKNLLYLSWAIVLSTTINTYIFNYDTVTLFLLVLGVYILFQYYKNKHKFYIIIYSIITTFLILARFPNIVILPISIVIFIILEKLLIANSKISKINLLKKTSIYLFFSLGLYVVIIFLIYGDLNKFFKIFAENWKLQSNDHNINQMIMGIINDWVKLIMYISLLLVISFLFERKHIKCRYYNLIILFISIITLIIFLKVEIGFASYNRNLSIFFSAIVLFFAGMRIFSLLRSKNYLIFSSIFIILSISSVTIIGSNTRLLKLSPFILLFLPHLIIWYRQHYINKNHFFHMLLLVVLIFAIFTRFIVFYEDSNIKYLNSKLDVEKLKFVYTTAKREQFIEKVIMEFNKKKGDQIPIMFYGKVSHIFYYLTGEPPFYLYSMWMQPDFLPEINQVSKVIKIYKPYIFLLLDYPENDENLTTTPIEKMIIKHGYTFSSFNGFKIYCPPK